MSFRMRDLPQTIHTFVIAENTVNDRSLFQEQSMVKPFIYKQYGSVLLFPQHLYNGA